MQAGMKHIKGRAVVALFAVVFSLVACATPPASAPDARKAMVAAADPRAVAAGVEMLEKGGTATDAAIAAMLVLGLVEPQSAGIGGGGFLLHYDATSKSILGYDGREQAPAAATPDMFLGRDGKPLAFRDAVDSGLSTGAPALILMLDFVHSESGKLDWATLFAPAIIIV